MKRILFMALMASFVFLGSCKQANDREIEMVSAMKVYEAVYGEENLQLVDVRTKDEFDVSHLKNAQNICVTSPDFKEKVASLDKEKPVYVYCKKGGRSAKAASILKDMGFTKVYDLQGGITSWQEEGLETIN
ncbi:rhodanese-like domain-containing protein [Aureisphaera galaxeae]|uniref:rhodanese-like domain-containing protein n=1 Tax=Aureisphaera galaxeae TaxID=1538023 RepID=UPI0023504F77|nr:rhodanese-like domain-containing protein [Aureisphaera galaxeae]MDC8004432.1 rhodanese-like domain-containing protein [Aureisphaera galaxeae]